LAVLLWHYFTCYPTLAVQQRLFPKNCSPHSATSPPFDGRGIRQNLPSTASPNTVTHEAASPAANSAVKTLASAKPRAHGLTEKPLPPRNCFSYPFVTPPQINISAHLQARDDVRTFQPPVRRTFELSASPWWKLSVIARLLQSFRVFLPTWSPALRPNVPKP